MLHDEILGPLDFRWMNYGVAPEDVDEVGLAYATGPQLLPPLSTLVKRVLGAPIDKVVELSNDPRFLTGVVPVGERRHDRERAVALLRDLPLRRRARRRARDAARDARRALSEQSRLEIDLSLVFPTRFSYGLMLGADVICLYGRDTDQAFGHLGLINIMGWADPERGSRRR